MKTRNIHSLVVAALFVAISCSCADSQSEGPLGTRIIDYWQSHSCAIKCKNPLVVVEWTPHVKVVRFDGDRPIENNVSLPGLREFLKAMPLSAWPKGPQIRLWYSDNNVVYKYEDMEKIRPAQHQNMLSVVQICNELGLTPTDYLGNPLKNDE